jgi:hypothetical protein
MLQFMSSARSSPVRRLVCLLSILVTVVAFRLDAQVTAGAAPGLNAALIRFFGDATAFTAHLEIRMTDAKGVESLDAPMQFAMLDRRMRGDLDVTKLKSKDLPPAAAAAAKTAGMDQVVTLVRPDRKEAFLYYPGFQACVVSPIAEADLAALNQPARIEKIPAGKETVDGHACIKNRVTVTEPNGSSHDAVVWNATDLKDFPLRIRVQDGTDTITLQFQQVKFERVDPKRFDLPEGTVRYKDMTELTHGMMKKLLGQAFGQ